MFPVFTELGPHLFTGRNFLGEFTWLCHQWWWGFATGSEFSLKCKDVIFLDKGKEGVSRCMLYPKYPDLPTPFLGWKWGGWTSCLLTTPLVHAYLVLHNPLSRFLPAGSFREELLVSGVESEWKETGPTPAHLSLSSTPILPETWMLFLQSSSPEAKMTLIIFSWTIESQVQHMFLAFLPVPRDPVYNCGVHSVVKHICLPGENRHSSERLRVKVHHKTQRKSLLWPCSQSVNYPN